jgi:CRISPR-associated protein Cmr4
MRTDTVTTPSTLTRGALLGLHALTSLHPGSGTALGAVDLPVQRERHTGWPTIAGSALKGILRDACREHIRRGTGVARDLADGHEELVPIFGPPTWEADKNAGALSVTDARLLAFPVRSLKGVFAWVSCPAVLERLQRDAALLLNARDLVPAVPRLEPTGSAPSPAITPSQCPCRVADGGLVLEEFDFQLADGSSDEVARWVARNLLPAQGAAALASRFAQQLVILTDNDFTHFARHATEITARIALDYETKTVKDGALFYQEFLPPETLFYAVVIANPSRRREGSLSAAGVLQRLGEFLPAYLQIGGDETTGKGYCATRLWTGAPHAEA